MPIVTETKVDVPIITRQEAQIGLATLLNSGGKWFTAYAKQRDTHECILGAHPFGLDTKVAGVDKVARLIAYPGYTDVSVDAMLLMLRHDAAIHPVQHRVDFRLRIIRIQKPEKNWHNPEKHIHDLFFELITAFGAFICGGCNDYSGQGRSGSEQLEAAFKFIAALYEKPIEEVVISEGNARAAIRKMRSAYDTFTIERSETAKA